MNSHITHYSSVKQNNDFILYHNRAKSSLSVSPTPHSSDKSPISELMKDFTKNQIMLSKEERLPLSNVSSPKNFMAQSPKLVTLRELPEGVIEPKSLIQTERDKRNGDLEKENKELRSLLKSRDVKLAQFLKANEDIQKRLGEYKSKEKLSNFQKVDVDALQENLEHCLLKIKELENEKNSLMTERSSWLKTTEEIDQGLQKYTKYVLHYVNKTDSHNFINFCFEDRFSSEKSLMILLQTKNYGIIALQAFKYLSDLLTRIGALQNPNQEQNKSSLPSERREPRGSEPSSICLSPLKNESREGTPRDLVKEMLEGTRLFLENFDKVHEARETPAQSFKSPKNINTNPKSALKKSSTTAELHKRQTPIPSTSRNVKIDVTNSATKLVLKKQLSPKQSITPQPTRQGSQTPKAMSTAKPTYAKMHEKKDAIADIRRWSERDIIHNQSGGKKLTLVERLEKDEKNKLESERVVLFSECASRRNSNQVRKEADSKAKISKNNDTRKNSTPSSNSSKLEARRDSHATNSGVRSKNTSENQYSKRVSHNEDSDRRSPFSVKSILKNAFENNNKELVEQRKYNSGEDFLDTLDGPNVGLNKKRNREHLEIQVETGKRPRNIEEMNKEEYFSQKGCSSSDVFPKEKTSPKALVGNLDFASLRNSHHLNKDANSHISKEKPHHYETPVLSSDDRLLRVLNQSPLSVEGGGDSSARWLAKDLAMFKNAPEPQPLDKLEQSNPKISYEDLRIIHYDDETKLAPGKFIARAIIRQEASKTHKEEKAERFVTFDGNDDLFTCNDKDNTPSNSKRNTPKAAFNENKNLFTGGTAKVSFDVRTDKETPAEKSLPSSKNHKGSSCDKTAQSATYMGTLEFNTSRSNYNVKDHQADGYSSARNRIFASEISNITHADKSLAEEW